MTRVGSSYEQDEDTERCRIPEDIFKCMIDFQPLKEPKLLHCGHSFCRQCLTSLVQSRQVGSDGDRRSLTSTGESQRSSKTSGSCDSRPDSQRSGSPTPEVPWEEVRCPICTRPTPLTKGGINDLPDNCTVLNLRAWLDSSSSRSLDELRQSLQEDTTACDSCNKVGGTGNVALAKFFCYKCSHYYCDECQAKHQQTFTDHSEVVSLVSDVSSMLNVYCQKHASYMCYFCLDCGQAMCKMCRLHDHDKTHKLVDIADHEAILAKRDLVRQLKPRVMESKGKALRQNTLLVQVQQHLYGIYASLERELTMHFRTMREGLEKWLKEWYGQMEDARHRMKDFIEKQLNLAQEELNFHVSSCDSLLEYVDHLLSSQQERFQPLNLYTDLLSRMGNVHTSQPDIECFQNMQVIQPSFTSLEKALSALGSPGEWTEDTVKFLFQNDRVERLNKMPHHQMLSAQLSFGSSVGSPETMTPPITFTPPVGSPVTLSPIFGHKVFDEGLLSLPDSKRPKSSRSSNSSFSSVESSVRFSESNKSTIFSTAESRFFLKSDTSIPQPISYYRSPHSESDVVDSPHHVENSEMQRSISEAGLSQISEDVFMDKPGSKGNIHHSQSTPHLKVHKKLSGGGDKKSLLQRLVAKVKESTGTPKCKKPVHKKSSLGKSSAKSESRYRIMWQNSGDYWTAGDTGNTASAATVSLLSDMSALSGHQSWALSGHQSWVVADHTKSKLAVVDGQTGEVQNVLPQLQDSFQPWGVCAVLMPQNQHYTFCTDHSSCCVRRFSMQNQSFGSHAVEMGKGKFNKPYGVCFSMNTNKLIVSDFSPTGSVIYIYDVNGMLSGKITSVYGSGESQLKYPWYIAMDTKNRLFISDRDNSSVKSFDINSGRFISRFKRKVSCPAGICVNSQNGTILVADRSGGHDIAVYTTDGRFIDTVKTEQDDISWPHAISTDHNGGLAVTEYLENSRGTFKYYRSTDLLDGL